MIGLTEARRGADELLGELARALGGLPPAARAEAEEALRRLEQALAAPRGEATNGAAPYRRPEARAVAPLDGPAEARLVTDSQGVILEVNAAAAAMLRGAREALVGKPLPFFFRQPLRQTGYSLLVRLRKEGGGVRDCPGQLQPLRGEAVDVLLDATAVADEDGAPTVVQWALHDATLLSRARQELQAQRALADSVVNMAHAAVVLLDSEGRIVRANPYLCAEAGIPEDLLLGRLWEGLVTEDGRAEARSALNAARLRGLHANFTAPLWARGGEPITIAWAATPLGDDGGAPRPLLLVGSDISELLRAQQKAVEAERLAAIGQVVATLAHESRNLLQRGRSNLDLLSWRLEGQAESLDLVARAQRALADLTRLFEDVRRYAAPLALELGPAHLGQVLRESWATVVELFPGRQAELIEAGATDLWCRADPFRLGQVFRIVLENSFEACPGPVRVEVACEDVELAGRPAVRLAIRDNGPGLTQEQRRRMFEPFYTTKAQGSGLGMAIARRIVDAHGGRLEAGDHGPPGAEIVLTLPRN